MSGTSAQLVAFELRKRLPGVGAKKLQTLLYYCQGHHLATFGRPLFVESILAWDMGPVVGAFWYAEKNGSPSPGVKISEEAVLNTIGYVVSRYGNLTGGDLERLTHAGDPWRDADQARSEHGSVHISNDEVERFFRSNAADPEDCDVDAAELQAWLRRSSPDRPTASLDTVESILARGRSHDRLPTFWQLENFVERLDDWIANENPERRPPHHCHRVGGRPLRQSVFRRQP